MTKEEYRREVIEILQEYSDDETMTINETVNRIMEIPFPEEE